MRLYLFHQSPGRGRHEYSSVRTAPQHHSSECQIHTYCIRWWLEFEQLSTKTAQPCCSFQRAWALLLAVRLSLATPKSWLESHH